MRISTMIPAVRLPGPASRGAVLAANLFSRAMAFATAVFASNIVFPAKAHLSRAQEASQARRIANSMRGTDRRLADEIFAAADRHERDGH